MVHIINGGSPRYSYIEEKICLNCTLLRCLVGGAKSSFDFLLLSFKIMRAAANAILNYFCPPCFFTINKSIIIFTIKHNKFNNFNVFMNNSTNFAQTSNVFENLSITIVIQQLIYNVT